MRSMSWWPVRRNSAPVISIGALLSRELIGFLPPDSFARAIRPSALPPDIPVFLSSSDYFSGRGTAAEVVLEVIANGAAQNVSRQWPISA
jgi:hypothetical protein